MNYEYGNGYIEFIILKYKFRFKITIPILNILGNITIF